MAGKSISNLKILFLSNAYKHILDRYIYTENIFKNDINLFKNTFMQIYIYKYISDNFWYIMKYLLNISVLFKNIYFLQYGMFCLVITHFTTHLWTTHGSLPLTSKQLTAVFFLIEQTIQGRPSWNVYITLVYVVTSLHILGKQRMCSNNSTNNGCHYHAFPVMT